MTRLIFRTLVILSATLAVSTAFAKSEDVIAIQILGCDMPSQNTEAEIKKIDVFFNSQREENTYLSVTGVSRDQEEGALLKAKTEIKDDGSLVIRTQSSVVLTISSNPQDPRTAFADVFNPTTNKTITAKCRVMSHK